MSELIPLPQNGVPPETSSDRKVNLVLLIFTVSLFFILIIVFIIQNKAVIQNIFAPQWFSDFSTMSVTEGFHKISIPNGNHWQVSYEADHDVIFQGTVLHNSPIREKGFEILTQDILVTTGDYADPDLVYTKVSDHHFYYQSKSGAAPLGTINLLHTLPMDEKIDEQLKEIKPGDLVIIKGWDIFQLQGWNVDEDYIGYWQDSGCNSTLVTEVKIIQKDD